MFAGIPLVKNIYLLVGTKKGAFILSSTLQRKTWRLQGPFLKGAEVNDIVMDTRNGKKLYAAVTSYWWGSNVHISRNLGKTWDQSEGGVRFPENSGKKVERVWAVSPGRESEPEVLYAGVDPGALFKSQDNGKNWSEVQSLTNHPTREKWSPGAGGMMVHSICFHPENRNKMFVGISAAGTFATNDGGKSWEPRNKNVLADFLPEKYPEVGQCVHHLELHPARPEVLYQQNHCGVYRSDDEGKEWTDISKGLPSRFGFNLQIHPHDPDTVYVIPEEAAEFRSVPKGEPGVYRSTNRGKTWTKLSKGFPKKNAFLHVYRQALKVDRLDPHGLYMGTSSGHVFYSRNEGTSWDVLVDYLPSIYSLNVAVA